MRNALSVDVEEYFHATEVQESAHISNWHTLPSRIEEQTRLVLELLDEHGVHATFFILGWIAERHPRMVRQIAERGHEIGCHSHVHQLVYNFTPREFRADTQTAVTAIEDACGVRPVIYRAPSYSITSASLWALEILVELGFTHDSSIYPITHDRYGIPGFGRHQQTLETPAGPIHEVPIATVALSPQRITPVGGGGYLRMLPYRYTAAGLRRINREEREPACVYFHPWELDAEQPRVAHGLLSRLRVYTGLRSMPGKLKRLLSEFEFTTITASQPSTAVVSC